MKTIPFLYRDNNLVIVRKPAGMSVSDCLEKLHNMLQLSTKKPFPREFFLSPVGELDTAVSGIQVFGQNPGISRDLQKIWDTRRVSREYLALVKGDIIKSASISFGLKEDASSSQLALTRYSPIRSFGVVSFLTIRTETECRYQIRRHFSRRCMNIVGDKKFGQSRWNEFFLEEFGLNRIFLHAHFLSINLKGYKKTIEVSCPLPDDLKSILRQLSCFSHTSMVLPYPDLESTIAAGSLEDMNLADNPLESKLI